MTQSLATIAPAQLAEYGISQEELAETFGDYDEIRDILPKWRFDGQYGVYRDLSRDPYNPDETIEQGVPAHPPAMEGIILALTHDQALLRAMPEEGKPNHWTAGFSQGWLCRTNDRRPAPKGQPPRLNLELTEDEQNVLRQRGAGTACAACPLQKWDDEINGRECQSGIRLLFLTSSNEVGVLMFGGSSARALDTFIGKEMKRTNKPVFSRVIKFGRTQMEDKARGLRYKVATFQFGDVVPVQDWRTLLDLRHRHQQNFEQVQDSVAESAWPAASTGAPEQSAPAPQQGTLTLDEDGNPIVAEEVVPPPTDRDATAPRPEDFDDF